MGAAGRASSVGGGGGVTWRPAVAAAPVRLSAAQAAGRRRSTADEGWAVRRIVVQGL